MWEKGAKLVCFLGKYERESGGGIDFDGLRRWSTLK